jgi:hypothetical protein
MNRQQLDHSAAKFSDNEIKFLDKIPEFSGWWDNCVSFFIQGLDERILLGSGFSPPAFIRPELADKGVVYDIGAAGVGRFHINNGIGASRPYGLMSVFFPEKAFSFEMADLTKR